MGRNLLVGKTHKGAGQLLTVELCQTLFFSHGFTAKKPGTQSRAVRCVADQMWPNSNRESVFYKETADRRQSRA